MKMKSKGGGKGNTRSNSKRKGSSKEIPKKIHRLDTEKGDERVREGKQRVTSPRLVRDRIPKSPLR